MAAIDVVIRFIGDAAKAVQAAKDVDSQYQRVASNMIKTGAIMSAAITVPLLAAAKSAATELGNAEKVGAQTRAVIESTGGAARVTAAQVSELSGAIADKAAMDDEAVQSGANLLLTFTRIRNEAGAGNDIFNQAVALSADLSTAWGIDMTQAATKVGKALNDPVAGMTALSKVGVTFSDQQKQTIKDLVAANDVLGAQKVILKELETQVGGSAAAYGDTLAGRVNRARETFMNMSATLIGVAAPGIEAVTAVVQKLADFIQELPAPLQTAIGLLITMAALAGPLTTMVGAIAKIAPHIVSAFGGVAPMIGQIGAVITSTTFIAVAALAAVVAAAVAIGYAIHLAIGGAAVDFEGASEAGKKWGDSLVAQTSQITDLTARHDQLKAALDEVRAKEITSIEDRVKQVEAIRTLKAALGEVEGQQKAAATAAETQRNAMDQLAASHTGVTNATNSQIQALNALNNAYLASQGGALGYEAAQLQVESAQLRANEAVAKFGPDSLEAREAANQLQQANLNAAGAAFKMQSDEQSLANMLKNEGVGSLIALRDTLVRTIQTHGDATGAVQKQVDKINELIFWANVAGSINKTAKIDADTQDGLRKLGDFNIAADNAARPRTAEINAIVKNSSLLGFATGGVVPGPIGAPMLAIVHGGEVITPPNKVATELLMAGGGGGTVVINNEYQVNVDVAAGVSPAEVGAATVDAIREYERFNGTDWRK